MSQSQRQRFCPRDAGQVFHGPSAWSPRGARLLLAATVAAVISGCASNAQVSDPLASLGNPFQRPTEAGFRSLIQANCGTMSIGSKTVSALLGSDSSFDGLVTALYEGDISNDEFMNQVLLQHPAPDANVPATGCVMDQLAQCFAETCKVQTPAEREKLAQAHQEKVDEIESTVTIDQTPLPADNAPEIERMIETSKEEGPKPLP
ncbi:hypothetical protein [Halochromatium sp.]